VMSDSLILRFFARDWDAMLPIMRASVRWRKPTYSTPFTCLPWRKSCAEQYWDDGLSDSNLRDL